MQAMHAPHCTASGISSSSVQPRLFKGFSLQTHRAKSALSSRCLLRHKQSRPVPTCSAAETGVIQSVDQSAGIIPQAVVPDARPPAEDWRTALQYLSDNSVHEVTIHKANKGGVKGMLAGIEGFVPYSKCYRLRDGQNAQRYFESELASPQPLKMKVKVVAADVDAKQLILSERAVYMDAAVNSLKPGDVVTCVVRSMVSYGAFCNIKDPQTGELTGGSALLYISDMSWDHVAVPTDVVQIGDEIQCKVKSVDSQRRRISLSLKLMEEDPLRQTLDKLFSPTLRDSVTEVPVNIPQGVKDICSELEKEDGIESVVLGRQAEERRVVSQDLELWISKEVLPDGFVLVTRAGRTVQELKLTTKLPLDGMKSAVQRVLQRLA